MSWFSRAPSKVTFNLDDADLTHFAEVAQHRRAVVRSQPLNDVIAAAREVLHRGMQAQPALFVRERYARLKSLLDMVDDPDWRLSDVDSQRVINALACFSAPAGGAVGSYEYAIMIELVSRDLHHDLQAYSDYCRLRARAARREPANGAARERWLAQKRDALQARMRARRMRELDAAGGAARRLFTLLGL